MGLRRNVNTGFAVRSVVFASVLALFSGGLSQCQEGSSKSPTDVTVSDLGLHPKKFDRHLVRVQAWLVSGFEGDRFLSDPKPQNMHDGSPAYVWLYSSPEREQQVYSPIGHRVSVYGSFTGYFHFVPKPNVVNGAFSPGNLQFEATEVSIPEQQPRTLAEATREGDLEEARRILRSGPNLNILDEYRIPPLFHAIEGGSVDIVSDLLAAGADPKFTAPGGDTALMMAAWSNKLTIAKALLDHGALVNAANSSGETALISASQTCPDGKMVQLLLSAGADPNAKGNDGGTALRAAAGNPLVIEKLLAAGADPTVKDKYGNTVESESCERGEKGHAQVCALVRHALEKK
jgi:ankyrin repeat protein